MKRIVCTTNYKFNNDLCTPFHEDQMALALRQEFLVAEGQDELLNSLTRSCNFNYHNVEWLWLRWLTEWQFEGRDFERLLQS